MMCKTLSAGLSRTARHHDLRLRREQWEQYDQYVRDLLLDVPDESVERMVLYIRGDTVRGVNRSLVVILNKPIT